jgi:hypothetical protein
MYGMINRSIEELVVRHAGEVVWERVKQRAGIDVDMFISNESYDDKYTYDLVAAASEEMSLPAASILRAFGEYWVLETGSKGYAELMDAGGSHLREFLRHLPNFHARISLMLPELRPPTFHCLEEQRDWMIMSYSSERPGLQEFVVGLFYGLGNWFQEEVEVELLSTPSEEQSFSEYKITWLATEQ